MFGRVLECALHGECRYRRQHEAAHPTQEAVSGTSLPLTAFPNRASAVARHGCHDRVEGEASRQPNDVFAEDDGTRARTGDTADEGGQRARASEGAVVGRTPMGDGVATAVGVAVVDFGP